MQASLGLSIDGRRHNVSVARPHLPECLERLTLRDLNVGGERLVDLEFLRHASDVALTVLRRDEGIEVVMLK